VRSHIRSTLDSKNFWGGLVFVNLVFLGVQPGFLVLSLLFVGALYLLLFVAEGLRSDTFAWLVKKSAKVCLWYCLFIFSALPSLAIFLALAGVPLSTPDRAPDWVMPASLVCTGIAWATCWLAMRLNRVARSRREADRSAREYAARTRERTSAQKRRDDARARCEVFFGLHGPEIGTRFPKAMYDDFARRYLGDDHPPEYVEERAEQLLALLQQHLDKVEPAEKPMDVTELAAWYKRTRAQIEALDLDERTKRMQLAELNARYAELMQEQIQNLHP
jgi:hypothetical protein